MDKFLSMKNTKGVTVVSILLVLLVIVVLAYITINKDKSSVSTSTQEEQEQQTNIMENTTDGVKIVILKEGTGKVSKIGDTVDMNYTGTLLDGTVFDSNVDPKFNHVEPFTFTIGAGQVIKGWDVGVEGMQEGEKRTLELAPEFAYGATGAGGVIPPNATLKFEVELVAIKQ